MRGTSPCSASIPARPPAIWNQSSRCQMNPTLRETQSDCQGATASGSHPPPHRISRLLALDYSWISRRASSTRLLRLIEIFDRSEFEIEGGGPGVTEYEPRRHRP